jgi:hypothetical protein
MAELFKVHTVDKNAYQAAVICQPFEIIEKRKNDMLNDPLLNPIFNVFVVQHLQ